MGYVSEQTKKGNAGEKTAEYMFRRLGYKVLPSTTTENKLHDIDGYLSHIPQFGEDVLGLDGKPISIKNEEDGYKFGDVYFEVASQVKESHRNRFPECSVDGWIDSVLHYSKAELFAIVQPVKSGKVVVPSLLVLKVDDIRNLYKLESYTQTAKVKSLSASRKAALCSDAHYPFCDARCYFMKRSVAEHISLINIT